jgi:hypothetical protein
MEEKMNISISEHFSLAEITCRCGCNQALINEKLYQILEDFRDYIGNLRMITHCVNRCLNHNKSIYEGLYKRQGKVFDLDHDQDLRRVVFGSKHIAGMAWDGHADGIIIKELQLFALEAWDDNILPGGLGLYSWGIHIDSGRKRKWQG